MKDALDYSEKLAGQNESTFDSLSLLAVADVPVRSTSSDKTSASVPNGYRLLDSEKGVKIFSDGRDYVVSVNLKDGGSLKLMAGDYSHAGSRKSGYGGVSPELRRMSAAEALIKSASSDRGSKCVVNGSFFADFDKPVAEIAFPLKVGGKPVSDGFAPVNKHAGKRLTLMLYPNGARIVPFNEADIDSFRQNGVLDSIVSLSPDVNIDGRKDAKLGRTFLGLSQKGADGLYSSALVFVSPSASQSDAETALKRFGAEQIVQFDGGGSSQLLCKDGLSIKSSRTVPQFLVIGTD
ncbi:hypothetical protein GC174_15085 [bacterium]|nr:hypothetical protein [bacterium]